MLNVYGLFCEYGKIVAVDILPSYRVKALIETGRDIEIEFKEIGVEIQGDKEAERSLNNILDLLIERQNFLHIDAISTNKH